MKLSFYLFIAAAGLVFAARAAESGSDTNVDEPRELAQHEMCRCEASWENFYNRRLGEDPSEAERERKLYHHYDYTQAYIHNGYYVIEGVTVVPSNLCNSFNLFGRRNLEQDATAANNFERDVITPRGDGPAIVSEETGSGTAQQKRGLTYCKCWNNILDNPHLHMANLLSIQIMVAKGMDITRKATVDTTR